MLIAVRTEPTNAQIRYKEMGLPIKVEKKAVR